MTPTNPYVHEPARGASRPATKTVPNHYVALYDYETAIDSLPFSKVRILESKIFTEIRFIHHILTMENGMSMLSFSYCQTIFQYDEFQIIDFTTNEWFLARKLKDNSEGFVPASYIAEYGSLKTYP